MTRQDAFNFMFQKSNENPEMRYGSHKTIREAHDELLDKIFADFKEDLEAAKAQGFRDAIKEIEKIENNKEMK